MREATLGPSIPEPSSEDKEMSLNDELIQEVEGYIETDEAERTTLPQVVEGELPPETQSAHTRSSISVEASTSDTRYVCRD